jgi:hypothetical protein
MSGASKQKEETMKLISNHELHQRSESELSALFRTVSEGLVSRRADRPSAATLSPRWKTSAGRARST